MSSDWVNFKLSNLISVKHGFAFKSDYFCEEPTPYQLVTPGNFSIGGGFQLGKGKYYSGPVPEGYVLKKGDVVVTMTDLSRGADTLGYAAVIPKTKGTIWLHNQRVGLVEVMPDAPILSKYLHYLMRSRDYRNLVVSSATGSTVKHTAPNRICEFKFMLPPVIEQEGIADTLCVLDDRISLLRETNATLEAIAQALFKSWFVDFDPVHAKQQGRIPEGMDETTAALFPDSFEESELGLVPKGWSVGTIANIALLNPESWTAKKHPAILAYIDLANAKDNVIASITKYKFYDAPSRARRVLRDGDTIVGTVRPGNRSFAFIRQPVENLTASTGFAVLRPTKIQNTEFIYLAATQESSIDYLAHVADGAAYPAVRPEVVAGMQCLLPTEDIMCAFHDLTAPILRKVVEHQKQAKSLSTIRDTLLPRLISGQLRIPEVGTLLEEVI